MIPRTLFSSDHELFRDSVRKFLEQDAVPFHHQWEKDGHIDRALWNKAGEAGMLCSHIPEEYGGSGLGLAEASVILEEVNRCGGNSGTGGSKAATTEKSTIIVFAAASMTESLTRAGDQFTAADIMMSFPVEAGADRAFDAETKPRLKAFLNRIHARPAYQRALERGGPYSYA